jgi:ABC-type antimicrobial peptide transport system permease subunit
MAESTVAGLLAGAAGAALAAVALGILGRTGIPASSDALTFFFAGPSLHPSFAPGSLGLVLVLVLGVGGLSGLYPAWIAMRVSPREAMQSAE